MSYIPQAIEGSDVEAAIQPYFQKRLASVEFVADWVASDNEKVVPASTEEGRSGLFGYENVAFDGGALLLRFEDGTGIALGDGGQSCCESRSMSCDDDLTTFKGGTLVSVTVADGPDVDNDSGDVNETQFLQVRTTYGDFTAVNHNHHNGYYGGFCLRMFVLKPTEPVELPSLRPNKGKRAVEL
jgi:hypothetical protein